MIVQEYIRASSVRTETIIVYSIIMIDREYINASSVHSIRTAVAIKADNPSNESGHRSPNYIPQTQLPIRRIMTATSIVSEEINGYRRYSVVGVSQAKRRVLSPFPRTEVQNTLNLNRGFDPHPFPNTHTQKQQERRIAEIEDRESSLPNRKQCMPSTRNKDIDEHQRQQDHEERNDEITHTHKNNSSDYTQSG